MRRDKAALPYQGVAQLDRAFDQVSRHVERAFVSVRATQVEDTARARKPLILDSIAGEGPIVGIRSALAREPAAAWLVVACDLPFLSDAVLSHLLASRDPAALATAYRSAHDGLPEPLCAIWEPAAAALLDAYMSGGGQCPRKFLIRHGANILEPLDRKALDNVNTPEEYAGAVQALAARQQAEL
jgi:molybdopterin-guanine dinucleotide biosynthesis protein A